MRIQVAIPEPHVSKDVLDGALEAVTRLNEQMIASGEVPSFERALRYGVVWKPEPPGDEHFDSADRVLKRGWGDCDDLAPYHAASLRTSGEDPEAIAVVRKSGPKRWHAVVQRGDGTIDDPSKRAGMGPGIAPGVFGEAYPDYEGIVGAAVPLMMGPHATVVGSYIIRPQIALRPVYGHYQARADLPWEWREHLERDEPNGTDVAMTALHTAPVAQTALTGAIDDVCTLARASGVGSDEHIDRLMAIADACEGADWQDLAGEYGEEHAEAAIAVVGSLFGKIARGVGKLAKKAIKPALSFVPGGNIANMALDATGALRGGGGRRRPAARPAAPAAAPLIAQPGLAHPRDLQRGAPVAHVPASGGRQINLYFY